MNSTKKHPDPYTKISSRGRQGADKYTGEYPPAILRIAFFITNPFLFYIYVIDICRELCLLGYFLI